MSAPTINGECDHADAPPPAASIADWTTNAACAVAPSWYMSLAHRLLTSPASRAVMIQAGDVSQGVEAATDLRVIAALPAVPSSLFGPHPGYGPKQRQPAARDARTQPALRRRHQRLLRAGPHRG
ncbi:MAG: hypothetical protein WDO13_00100 [Verrucomicrobiota bacterium]